MSKETLKIHVAYWLLILGAVIVVLLAVKWGAIPELVTYLTFALTLTSLVLAVLAIVYAFFSSSAFHQNVGVLKSVSSAVTEATAALSRSTSELEEKVGCIPDRLEGVEKQVTRTHDLVRGLSENIAGPTEREAVSDSLTDASERLVSVSALAGFYSMYAAVKADVSGLRFTPEKLALAVPHLDARYTYAWLMAIDAVGLIKLDYSDDDGWSVRGVADGLAEMIEKRAAELRAGPIHANAHETDEQIAAYFDQGGAGEVARGETARE